MEASHRPFTQEFCQPSVSCLSMAKMASCTPASYIQSNAALRVQCYTKLYSWSPLPWSDKQEIRIFVQQLYSAGSIKCYPVSNMTRFSYVNLLKSFLALLLFGFLLHPGRFAVLQYQLLAPLPKWERCTAHCTDNRLDLYI